jgi:hypothetical protein
MHVWEIRLYDMTWNEKEAQNRKSEEIVVINIYLVRESITHNEIPSVNIPDPSRTDTIKAHLSNSGLA